MISLFDADDAFADDSAMGYQRYTTDFRYGIKGLSLLVGQREEGVVYAFCGKSGKSLKFLEFEKDAVWLTQVKIRRGRFPFPRAGEARVILAEELSAIVVSALAVAKVEDRRRYVQTALF